MVGGRRLVDRWRGQKHGTEGHPVCTSGGCSGDVKKKLETAVVEIVGLVALRDLVLDMSGVKLQE